MRQFRIMDSRISALFVVAFFINSSNQAEEPKLEALTSSSAVADFAPRAPEDHMNVRVPELGPEFIISIKISAKPEPSIYWKFGQNSNVKPGSSSKDQRIHAKHPQRVAPDVYLCQLVISSIELVDIQILYELHASNSRGTGKFIFHLNFPNKVEMGGKSTGGGYSPSDIVTICVLSVSVIAIICVLCTRGACHDSCEYCGKCLSCSRCLRSCP